MNVLFLSQITFVVAVLIKCNEAGSIGSVPNDERIVGGQETTIEEHPYQVSLMHYGSHSCGASIISPLWVVTAAHCVNNIQNYYMNIRSGSSSRFENGTVHTVTFVHKHERYWAFGHDYDIALIKVIEPFQIGTPGVDVVSLPDSDDNPAVGSSAVVTGWGRNSTEHNGMMPEMLREVTVQFIDHDECEEYYEEQGDITPRMICAGWKEGAKDACQGDSGGPLVANNTLYGIVSWGNGCALPNFPGVYTKVSVFREWIRAVSGV